MLDFGEAGSVSRDVCGFLVRPSHSVFWRGVALSWDRKQ